jgi:hypothetical protein
MKKAINLQLVLPVDGTRTGQALAASVQHTFAEANPQLRMTIKNVSAPDADRCVTVAVLIEGDQEGPSDFAVLTTAALDVAVALLPPGQGLAALAALPPAIREVENEDEDSHAVLASPRRRDRAAPVVAGGVPSGLRLATRGARHRPPRTTFQDCPAVGDGGDADLNSRKNRTDSGEWYPVELNSICDLPWPAGVADRARSAWSVEERAAVTRYEGIPVQVEGWLAGAKAEDPEPCNCHAADHVNYHLWLVEEPGRDRTQAVACVLTPRVRAQHPRWTFDTIAAVVRSGTPVRLSGWLLLDETCLEQVGRSRATPWAIHPIVVLEVQQDDEWIMLGAGQGARGLNGDGSAASLTAPASAPGSTTIQ